MRIAFRFYDLLADAAVLALVPWELARRFARRSGREELGQRLGRAVALAGAGPRVLIHAVSVGEMRAAGALIPELARRVPSLSILLTAGNSDGMAAAALLRETHPAIRFLSLLPWDRGRAVRAWLRALRPDFVLVVETEIWPGLFRACADLSVPLAIVNGRLPAREAKRYGLARSFFREVLRPVRWIEAQTEGDLRRFVGIGADPNRVTVGGNLKFDAAAAFAEPVSGGKAGEEPLLVAGSTHAPEERLLLDGLVALRGRHPSLRLALAPRRVSRARKVLSLAQRRGFRAALESVGSTDWDVLVVDRIGRLAALYARSAVAFVGGTVADRGGHNPLEAASLARAIVAGPSRRNFAEVFAGLDAARAIAPPASRAGLVPTIGALLDDRDGRRALGGRAREYFLAGRGAAARLAERIASEMRESPSEPDRGR